MSQSVFQLWDDSWEQGSPGSCVTQARWAGQTQQGHVERRLRAAVRYIPQELPGGWEGEGQDQEKEEEAAGEAVEIGEGSGGKSQARSTLKSCQLSLKLF